MKATLRSKLPLVFCLLILFAFSLTALAQQQYFLPQVANGSYSDGSYRTTFIVVNNTSQAAFASLTLTDDKGAPFIVTIPGMGTSDEFALSLAPGATSFLQTDGKGPLTTGAAEMFSTSSLSVSAIFSVYDAAGRFLTESGVGSSSPGTEFVIPVDASTNFNTAVALFNAGSNAAAISFSLVNPTGQQTATASLALGAGRHVAQFVCGTGQLFPAITSFRGTLVISSPSTPISAVTLRMNLSPLSFTSLPAVPRSGGKTQIYLPQVANGTFSGGSFRTSFLIFNLSQSTATAILTLTADNGSPLPVNIPGRGNASVFTVSLPAGGSAFLETDGAGALAAGAANILSVTGQPIGASAIFTVLDPQQRFLTEAGVGDSPTLTEMTLPADLLGAATDTGVAFFNPGTSSVTLSLRLLDGAGAAVGSTTLPLAPRNHTARFVSELFPGQSNLKGSLAITTSGGGIAAVTLRENKTPLTYTTLPVASGVAGGTAPAAKVLLSKSRTGITATNDTTLNESLAPGFKISGSVSGSGFAVMVIAQTADGTFHTGAVNFMTRRYLIVVPAGTYNLLACLIPDSGSSAVITTFKDPTPVVVSADTTRDLNPPTVTTFMVTGQVTGLQALPSSANAALFLSSADNQIQGTFTLGNLGVFQGQLPNGTYTASLMVPKIQHTAAQVESLTLYNLGSLTVSGGPANRTFAVLPTATLSGRVSATGLSPLPANTSVMAMDTSGPAITSFTGCAFPMTVSNVSVDSAGPYTLLLANGRSYTLYLQMPVLQGATSVGTLLVPSAGVQRTLSGNSTYDFTVPALPPFVTFSGKISDNTGQGVDKVSVGFSSQRVTNMLNVTYSASATTDSSGNYRITLLSGIEYTATFTPTPPQP